VWERIREISRKYVAPLQAERINGNTLRIEGAELLDLIPGQSQKVLVAGKAGGGKSTTLAALVERQSTSAVPVIPIRFDQLPEGILTTKELGAKLLLPESPALTLAGVASGDPAVMVIDQLDAISLASGRRTDGWSLFESLLEELARYPNVSVVVGCREFDLEHDRRMRSLTAKESGFVLTRLRGLSEREINSALEAAGTAPQSISNSLRPILTIPLHLAIFLRLDPSARTSVRNRDELFASYWVESEQRLQQRLGSEAPWTQVIDKLVDWLSKNQELSAPVNALDDYSKAAKTLASQHFFLLVDDRYRFFHESLFDYAFARRFVTRGGRLRALLTGSEQHLFRRAQVRQVLSFCRTAGERSYRTELSSVLQAPDVRFHIKKSVLQWLSSLEQPQVHEWKILEEFIARFPELLEHVLGAVASRVGWFDVMDGEGFFDDALAGSDERRQQQAVWLMSFQEILESRSDRIAEIIARHRTAHDRWDNLIQGVFWTGNIYHDRKLFDLYLTLVDDGAFAPDERSGRDFWSLLYSCSEKKPEYAAEAVAHWFDRQVKEWKNGMLEASTGQGGDDRARDLKKRLEVGGQHTTVIHAAARAASTYSSLLLPRVVDVIRLTAEETPGSLRTDPIWRYRSPGNDHQWSVSGDLFENLAGALEEVSRTSPEEADTLLASYQDEDSDSVAFLALRTWAAAPRYFGDRIIEYLLADSRRLEIGYLLGGGSVFVSAEAIRVASMDGSEGNVRRLETAILDFRDAWEQAHPKSRGHQQLLYLTAFDPARLSESGRKRLQELQRKFPSVRHEPPSGIKGGFVPAPISTDAMEKMSDKQWVRAMSKYSGVQHGFNARGDFVGGEHQISIHLQNYAQKFPARFIALSSRMTNELSPAYFEQICHGVAAALNANGQAVTAEEAALLIRRLHELPGRPSGRAIARLVQTAPQLDWPDDIFDISAWYATEDPDPASDTALASSVSADRDDGMDLHHRGLNSARGAAAEAIGGLLFSQPKLRIKAEPVMRALSVDPSSAVRASAMVPLLAWLNLDGKQAIAFFQTAMEGCPELLPTRYVGRFIHFASLRDFPAMWPYLSAMLAAEMPTLVYTAARGLCLLSFDVPQAAVWIQVMTDPSVEVRKGFANVYAANVAHPVIGKDCRAALKKFFNDPDELVRVQAATAFEHMGTLDTAAEAELLDAFLESKPSLLPLVPVVRALVQSPVQLPDLVCKLAETCIAACRKDAGNIASSGALIAMDLSKIVVRLYAQTNDDEIRYRCLSLIDEMELYNFVGLSNELETVDR
jgi:hypothetical protein